MAVELAGDEQLSPIDARLANTTADGVLVVVVLRGVDQPITRLNRRAHRRCGLGALQR
jgi:hypothetical protein